MAGTGVAVLPKIAVKDELVAGGGKIALGGRTHQG
jgi:hypothetical protein